MTQRDRVAMTPDEVAEFVAAGRKVQLATNGPDGYPHLVTMYYALVGGRIAFWTYRKSQKALNLERDPRISCLVESGEQYFDLRGVLVQGTARRVDDPAEVVEIGRRISSVLAAPRGAGPGGQDGGPDQTWPGDSAPDGADALAGYVQRAALKRVGFVVEPGRVISWDHAKLLAP